MSNINARLRALGYELPIPEASAGSRRFHAVRLLGSRALISGHGPQNPDGTIATPLGKVGRDLTIEQAYDAARLTGLSMLGSLERALGDLDRIVSWGRVFGMVNSAPGFNQQPAVMNGFSELILEVFGPETGGHSRSAVGMAELPGDIPVEIEAEVVVVT